MWVVPVAEVLNERSGCARDHRAPGRRRFRGGHRLERCALPRLMQPDGTPANPDEPGLASGDRFEILDEAAGARLTTLNRAVARHEAFWIEHLATAEPFDFGALASSAPEVHRFSHMWTSDPGSDRASSTITGNLDEALLAGAQAHFARLGDHPAFACAYTDAHLSDTVAGVEQWFSAHAHARGPHHG